MQKFLWSDDRKEIIHLLTTLVSHRHAVGIKVSGLSTIRSIALKLHYHQNRPYLLFHALPIPLKSGQGKMAVFFKLPGYPLLSFECPRFFHSEKYFAVEAAPLIHKVQLRQADRFLAPQGSIVTFFTPQKQRLSLCRLSDISTSGARIEGSPVYPLSRNDTIGPCTLSMSEYQALIVREVTLSSARIAWIDRFQDGRLRAGIRFESSKKEHIQLASHLEYLTHQSPFPFQPAATPFRVC